MYPSVYVARVGKPKATDLEALGGFYLFVIIEKWLQSDPG
jgi:hypothetical protein